MRRTSHDFCRSESPSLACSGNFTTVETTWFERHHSKPMTELPEHWPEHYRSAVKRRIEVIQSNRDIALIEAPEYKRRWTLPPWEELQQRALENWLLDRMEAYIEQLARAMAGRLGGKVGLAPHLFLKKLVADVLDRIELFPDFDPRQHYALTVSNADLTEQEREAVSVVHDHDAVTATEQQHGGKQLGPLVRVLNRFGEGQSESKEKRHSI